MEFLNVIIAAIAAFVLGAGWYNVFSKPWIEASGVSCDAEGKPVNMQKPQVFGLKAIRV